MALATASLAANLAAKQELGQHAPYKIPAPEQKKLCLKNYRRAFSMNLGFETLRSDQFLRPQHWYQGEL